MDSIRKTDLECKLLEFCENSLSSLGYRVVDLDCRLGASTLVRIFIDSFSGDKQVSLEDCVVVSRSLNPLIETSGILEGGYELEVSSPGLDRRLRLAKDFEQAAGKELKLSLVESIPGIGAQPRGILKKVIPGCLEMEISGKEVKIPLNQIKKAHTVWEFRI